MVLLTPNVDKAITGISATFNLLTLTAPRRGLPR